MTDAVLLSPIHPRKQVKRFGDVSENDHDKTSCPTSCSKEVTVFPLWNKTAEPESNTDAGTKAISGLSNVILIYAALSALRCS